MWLVQVIEIGTGKVLEEGWNRSRELMESFAKEMKEKYPNQSVCLDYNS